jgi:hypothetical protein
MAGEGFGKRLDLALLQREAKSSFFYAAARRSGSPEMKLRCTAICKPRVFATVIKERIVRVERSARNVADLMQPVLRTASRQISDSDGHPCEAALAVSMSARRRSSANTRMPLIET